MAKKKNYELDAAIGQRLCARRKAANMSQGALGDELDVTFQQVQKYESGANGLSASQLTKVCKTFNVSPNEMMGWTGSAGTVNGAPTWDKIVAKHGIAMEKFGARLVESDTKQVLKLVDLFNVFLKQEKADGKDSPRKVR